MFNNSESRFWRAKRVMVLIVLIGLLPALFTLAQTPTSESAVQVLQQRIAELQKQIVDLQAQLEIVKKTEVPIAKNIIFTKTLQRGMKDDEVRQLQEFFKQFPEIYPEGLTTGYFGPLTEASVKRFQSKYDIEAIGIVGPKTRQRLNELFQTVTPEQKPEEQKPIQISIIPTCGNRICEANETSESCPSDCAISFNDCMSVVKNGDSSQKIDVVFLADGFAASELANFVTEAVPLYSGIREGSWGLLSREPFKSAKEKFNIWAIPIAETLDCYKINCHRSSLGGETYKRLMAILSRCPFTFDEVVVVSRSALGRISGFQGEKFTYIYYSPDDQLQGKNGLADVLLHEFAHSFARLTDDYGIGTNFNTANPEPPATIGCDTAGCPQWCSGTPRYSYKDYAPECFGLSETDCKSKDNCLWILDSVTPSMLEEFPNIIPPYYSGTSCIARRSSKDNGVNCLPETGCYQGCGGGHANWWRSADYSVMTSDSFTEFSGYHKKIILEALSKYK